MSDGESELLGPRLGTLQSEYPLGRWVAYDPKGEWDAIGSETGKVAGWSSSGRGVYVQFEDGGGAKYVEPRFLMLLDDDGNGPADPYDAPAADDEAVSALAEEMLGWHRLTNSQDDPEQIASAFGAEAPLHDRPDAVPPMPTVAEYAGLPLTDPGLESALHKRAVAHVLATFAQADDGGRTTHTGLAIARAAQGIEEAAIREFEFSPEVLARWFVTHLVDDYMRSTQAGRA